MTSPKSHPNTKSTKKSSSKPRPSSKRKKSTSKNQSQTSISTGKSFKIVLIGMLGVALMLVAIILLIDQKAMKKGQKGIWETITNKEIATTHDQVESTAFQVLKSFGITKKNKIRKGKIIRGHGERVNQQVYVVGTQQLWNTIAKQLENQLDIAGVKIYNRFIVKNDEYLGSVIDIGTLQSVTHRIEVRFYPNGYLSDYYPHEKKPETYASSSPQFQSVSSTHDLPCVGLIIDDFGQDLKIAKSFLNEVNIPLALAVIPGLKYSKDIISEVHKKNQTAFLHMPMEPMDTSQMKSDQNSFLRVSMNNTEIMEKTEMIIDGLPNIDGINNHMGSRFTSDERCMRAFLSVLEKRNIPFVDSRTIANTVGAKIADEIGVAHCSRDVFIDQGYKGGDVEANLEKLVNIAIQNGHAVGIGHATTDTLKKLKATIPLYKNKVSFVPVTQLLTD